MPILSAQETKRALERLLAGEVRLYGWGAVQHLSCYDWRTPLPFVGIVDSMPAKWGSKAAGQTIMSPAVLEREDPATTLVMILPYSEPFFDEIVQTIDRIGPFQILPYMETELIAAHLGGTATSGAMLDGVASDGGPDDAAAMRARRFSELIDAASRFDPIERLVELVRRHRRPPRALGGSGPVCLALTRLNLGGAERQMLALGGGLVDEGWPVKLLVTSTEPKEATHYVAAAAAEGIEYEPRLFPASLPTDDYMAAILADLPPPFVEIFSLIPAYLIVPTFHLLKAFEEIQPDLVVSYLDPPNAAASLAALLAGVPRIVMSGRNFNPSHFPMSFAHVHERLRQVYRAVIQFPEVVLSGNSPTAAASYAEWVGLPRHAVPMIPNAIGTQTLMEPGDDAGAELRERFGLESAHPLVLGVFRLAPEKDPLGFVEVIDRLRARHPDIRALICGTGPLRSVVEAEIAHRGLEGVLTLGGAIENVSALYRQSTVLLHTAEFEGMPNVVMEAQAFGLPVVCTRAGGTPDCLSDLLAPFMHEVGDYEGLARSCLALIDAPDRRKALSLGIEHEARQRFSVRRLVGDTLRAAGIAVAATSDRVA